MVVLPEITTFSICLKLSSRPPIASLIRLLIVKRDMLLNFFTPSFSAQTIRFITSSPQVAWRLCPDVADKIVPSAISTTYTTIDVVPRSIASPRGLFEPFPGVTLKTSDEHFLWSTEAVTFQSSSLIVAVNCRITFRPTLKRLTSQPSLFNPRLSLSRSLTESSSVGRSSSSEKFSNIGSIFVTRPLKFFVASSPMPATFSFFSMDSSGIDTVISPLTLVKQART